MTATEFDPVMFNRNRDLFPESELTKYWGRHVAWNYEGTRILADGATGEEVDRRLKELGIDPCSTVESFVHDPSASYLGGLWLNDMNLDEKTSAADPASPAPQSR